MRKITGKTRLVGLLGQPVNHSLSPTIHNAAFEEMGLDWCYLAIPCETKDLKIITESLKKINCKGLNVTIPHKKSVLTLCSEISKIAKDIQAVNTLIPNFTSGWEGTNTDVEGFIQPLLDKELEGKKAVILGSGGSARAIVAGLTKLKLKEIIIISRNINSLNSFIKDTNKICSTWNKNKTFINGIINNEMTSSNHINSANIIINTTPIGMKANSKLTEDLPFGKAIWENLPKKIILYDLIYTPRPTNWLKLGIEKNCITIDGLEMLIHQGAASLKLWSGYDNIPIQTMRMAAQNELINYNISN